MPAPTNPPGLIRIFAAGVAIVMPINTITLVALPAMSLQRGQLITVRLKAYVIVPAGTANVRLGVGAAHANNVVYNDWPGIPFPPQPGLGAQQFNLAYQYITQAVDEAADSHVRFDVTNVNSTAPGTLTYGSIELLV